MTGSDPVGPAGPADSAPLPGPPAARGDQAKGRSQSCAVGCAIAFVVLLVGIALALVFVRPLGPDPHPVNVPTESRDQRVVLDAAHPRASGRFSMTYRRPEYPSDVSLGLSMSLPDPAPSTGAASPSSAEGARPTRLFSDPLVSMSLTSASGPRQDCTAPCGIKLGGDECDQSGMCQFSGTIVVRLLSGAGQGAALTVTATITGPADGSLQDAAIELAIDPAEPTPPGGS